MKPFLTLLIFITSLAANVWEGGGYDFPTLAARSHTKITTEVYPSNTLNFAFKAQITLASGGMGLAAACAVDQAVEAAVDTGLEALAKEAAALGKTAAQQERFYNAVRNVAGTGLMVFGASKMKGAVKGLKFKAPQKAAGNKPQPHTEPRTEAEVKVGDAAAAATNRVTALDLRGYIREVENVSQLPIGEVQLRYLKEAIQRGDIKKLTPQEKQAHRKPYQNKVFKDQLIAEWEVQTQQKWPTTGKVDRAGNPVIDPVTGLQKRIKYQFHHIMPQEYAGAHAWWNGHPVHQNVHQGGVHGKNSKLRDMMKKEDA